jgi:universal stress protein F
MSKRILCAVDVDAPAQDSAVLEIAARLARFDDAKLDIVTVVPDFGNSMVGSFFEEGHHEKLVAEVKAKQKAMSLSVLGNALDSDARHIVATGSVYQEILNTAEKAGSDLIVIGAHDPDLKDFLLGPNASRIVRHARCSVHVVR